MKIQGEARSAVGKRNEERTAKKNRGTALRGEGMERRRRAEEKGGKGVGASKKRREWATCVGLKENEKEG